MLLEAMSTQARSTEHLPGADKVKLPPELKAGDEIDHFRVVRIIRTGGFGSVYEANNSRNGERVAIKLLHSYYKSGQARRRFHHEARALSKLGHPNIVGLREFGDLSDGRPYLAMELLAGRDLAAEIKHSGRLSVAEILPVLEPLCSALETAHGRGIIHRDIKPSNVFLTDPASPRESPTPRGPGYFESRRVVLLDFGIAKTFASEGLTASGQLVGTPPCMAPEQLSGNRVDQRTDVYGLGALVFTMLTGRLPFQSNEPGVIRHLMRSMAEVPRVSYFVSVPNAVDEVVAQAMSRDPAQRFPRVSRLADAFREIVESQPGPHSSPAAARADQVKDPGARLTAAIDMVVDPALLEEPDEPLLDDLEAIVPTLAMDLDEAGFRLTAEAGNKALFSLALPPDPETERPARYQAIKAALDAFNRLAKRPGADARIAVHLTLDRTESNSHDHNAVADPGHAFSEPTSAVLATTRALADLELARASTSSPTLFILTGQSDI